MKLSNVLVVFGTLVFMLSGLLSLGIILMPETTDNLLGPIRTTSDFFVCGLVSLMTGIYFGRD